VEPLPSRSGRPARFGIRITTVDRDKIVGEMDADERHVSASGTVQGGALMAFGDDLGGTGARFQMPPGARTTTIESKTDFFRACAGRRIISEAVPLHIGRRTLVWRTSIFGLDGEQIALLRQSCT
jgi:1,4-dihydroxy-2-naphthoyl-CoA hydrolase